MTDTLLTSPDEDTWPPEFSLDQEKILNLLTGDRFYSNPSAALRKQFSTQSTPYTDVDS